ncbi:cation:proton antiporter [Alicyclobacillus fructus]|uniref:cation:proton antiporter n=1 Tax=Alicyclobacillus fructus TaxID=2816082 RepID=UPI001A8E42E1|nr:sodium:proton antiporter [Alicyclobacillus fructus]
MTSNALQIAETYLFALFVILGSGAVGGWLAERLRLPDIVVYVIIGFLLGPSVLGVLHIPAQGVFHDAVLSLGAAWIVFQGGLEMRFQVLRQIWVSVVLLATVGLVMTAAVVGVAAHILMELPVLSALLLGSLLASTDPAALVPIFQRLSIRARVAQAVIAESAFTDATGAMLTALVLSRATMGTNGRHEGAGFLLSELVRLALGGAVIGVAIGLAAAWLVARHKPVTPGGRSLFLVLAALGSYAVAAQVGASGFMANFAAGMALAHAPERLPRIDERDRASLETFVDALSLQFRILIFVSLGSQMDLQLMMHHLDLVLGVVAAFMLIARPLTVLVSLVPDRRAKWTWREIAFFFWVRETGTIAMALAGLVQGAGVAGGSVFTQVAATAVIATLLVQASTTSLVARWLGLVET